jgi:hypothetical protein
VRVAVARSGLSDLPAGIVVATNADGRIARLDEYLDSAHAARITGYIAETFAAWRPFGPSVTW